MCARKSEVKVIECSARQWRANTDITAASLYDILQQHGINGNILGHEKKLVLEELRVFWP